MRCLLVGSYLAPDVLGGAEDSAENLRKILVAAGHEIVTLRWKPAAGFALTARTQPIGPGDWAVETWRPYPPIETRPGLAKLQFYGMELATRIDRGRLGRLLDEQAIDLVIINSFRGIGYDLVRALAAAGRPVMLILHDFALTCMNKGKSRKGQLCAQPCGLCRRVTGINRASLARGSRVALVAPSRYVVDSVADALALPDAERHCIPNPNTYVLSPRVREPEGPLTVGFVGRLDVEKGIGRLLAIADGLHDRTGMRLVIAGRGLLVDEVTAFAATRPWVDYRGQVPGDRVHEVFDAMDVMTIPSLWPENFPGVVVQALANGAPVIGFDRGGIPEMVADGVAGYVVPFGDFEALADRIVALDQDRARLTALSRGALDSAQRYDPAVLGQRYLDLVADLVA